MKLSLRNIPNEGSNFSGTIPLAEFNSRIHSGRASDIVCLEAPQAEIRIIPSRGGFEVMGEVRSRFRQPCPRCLEEIEFEAKEAIRLVLRTNQGGPNQESRIVDEDWSGKLGILDCEGDSVDLTDVLEETLLLALSPFGQDHEGCKGFNQPEEDPKDKPSNPLAAQLKNLKLH